MSDSSDVDAVKSWANQLETERAQLKRDLEHSADETQVYKEQCGELQAQLVQIQAQCTELKVENRHLTRKLNEQTAPPASFAATSDRELALLRQQLAGKDQVIAGKDQVIAAQDEKYQALLNSIKPLFKPLFNSTQSLLAAMPEDAAETLRAWQNELALGGPPSEADAHSSHNDPGPMKTFQQQIQRSDNGSKTLIAQGVTKTPAERPARQSKSPSLRQEPKPSVEATTGYSQALTTQRAEEPLRSRPGQAPVNVSQEVSAKQEQLRAEKREDIQKSAGRSQKPNKAGGSKPPQKAEGRADTTLPSAPKHNVAATTVQGRSSSAPSPAPKLATTAKERLRQFGIEPAVDRPSPSAPKQDVAATSVRGQSSPAESVLKENRQSSSAPKHNLAATNTPDRRRQADLNPKKGRPSSSVPRQNVAADFRPKEDLAPSPAPGQRIAASSGQARPHGANFMLKEDLPPSPVPAPSFKGTQGSTSRELTTQTGSEKLKTAPSVTNPQIQGKSLDERENPFDNREGDPFLKASARYGVPSFLGFDTGAAPQKPNLQASMPQESVIKGPTSQGITKSEIDLSGDRVDWANEMEANATSDEEQPVFDAYGSGKRKAKGRFMPRLRGGQTHRQDRVRGRGLRAPSPRSDITDFLRDGP